METYIFRPNTSEMTHKTSKPIKGFSIQTAEHLFGKSHTTSTISRWEFKLESGNVFCALFCVDGGMYVASENESSLTPFIQWLLTKAATVPGEESLFENLPKGLGKMSLEDQLTETVLRRWKETADAIWRKSSWPSVVHPEYAHSIGFAAAMKFALSIVHTVAERKLDGETSTDQIREALETCREPVISLDKFRRSVEYVYEIDGKDVSRPTLRYDQRVYVQFDLATKEWQFDDVSLPSLLDVEKEVYACYVAKKI